VSALLRRLASPLALRVLRIAIGLVFIGSGIAKIGENAWLAQSVHNFHIVPWWSEHLIAIVLPWIELVAGFALVAGFRARAGAAVTLGLMAIFTLAVGIAWARGLDFRCGCFGKADAGVVGATKLAENLGLTLLAALAMRRPAGTN
jgi:uncharacterized membrane protein YphA (DoxX/SURF4 family)